MILNVVPHSGFLHVVLQVLRVAFKDKVGEFGRRIRAIKNIKGILGWCCSFGCGSFGIRLCIVLIVVVMRGCLSSASSDNGRGRGVTFHSRRQARGWFQKLATVIAATLLLSFSARRPELGGLNDGGTIHSATARRNIHTTCPCHSKMQVNG